MEAPDTFHPSNVLKSNRGFPPPIRLGYTKAELLGDASHLIGVDEHAIKVASYEHKSFKDLLWHLVFSRNLFSDLDKARVIFKWMTTKNLSTIKFDKYPEGSAEELFKALVNKETTYAKVFAIMCGYAGLYCVVLTGYAKGRDFHPGDSFTGESNHSWNAVYVDENWHLVDTKWAAMAYNNNNSSLTVEDDFYFLTDPEQFIYSHWPHQTIWQFLHRKISLLEFQELPFVKPAFFKTGIQLGWTEKPTIKASHGVATWTLKNPKPLKLAYKVTLLGAVHASFRKKGPELKWCVYQESKTDETRIVFRAPKAGTYLCKFYAKGVEPEDQKKHLTEIVEYKVEVKEPALDAAALPPCSHTVWGPGIKSRKLGLEALHKPGVVASLDPTLDIRFQKTKPLNVICKLRRRDVSEAILDRCIKVTNADKITISLNLPEPGEYGVDVFVSEKKSKYVFHHACQYLVLYLADDEKSAFVDEICREHVTDDSANDSYVIDDKEQKKMSWNIPAIEAIEIVDRKGPPTPPEDFNLAPANVTEAPKPAPVSMTGVVSFYDFTDRRAVEALDAHAEEVALSNHDTFRDLMWDLLFSVHVTNDLAKARLIFRWITCKRLEEINFSHVDKDSPEEVLVWLKVGRSSHAHVFYTMACFAGLHCKVISGLVKGANFQIGSPMNPDDYQHWWNAVYIYGKWCLVDSYLATIPIVNKTGSGELKYSFNEHYFLVDPHKIIYTHFPDEPVWQLSSNVVTMDEFILLPKITPHFLYFGLQTMSHKAGAICTREETEIQLSFPPKRTGLKFVFSLLTETGSDELGGNKLSQYGMVESLPTSVIVRISLPKKGVYSLHIFAKEDTPTGKDISFSQVCEYQLNQEQEPKRVVCPYPPCSSLMWGPGPGFYQLGLTPGNNRAIVYTKHGRAEVRIKMVKPIQLRSQVRLSAASTSPDVPLVVYKIVDNMACFIVVCEEKGSYGLEIYARDPDTVDTEDMRFRQVAQYLIECNEEIKGHSLPKLPPGFLGPQPKFTEFGLRTLNEHDPLIELKETNSLEIQLGTSRDMKFNAQLVDALSGQEFSDFIFIQTQPSIVTFLVNIPASGFFKLQIHGNVSEDETHTSLGLFNYLIHCREVKEPVYPFPRQLGHWKEGCYMFEPLILNAENRQPEVKFRTHVPRAKQVVIFIDKNVHPLESLGPVQWEGSINLEKYYGTDTKVILAANYGGDEERFATLLEYRI